jgi:hypothetical protein
MERHPLLKRWFVAARDGHDIHHWSLNDDGFMDKNFGIAFFFFDRLFGTLAHDAPAFNRRGYASALWRFGDLLRSPGAPVGEINWPPPTGRPVPDQHPRSAPVPSEVVL